MILQPFNNVGTVDLRRAQYDALSNKMGLTIGINLSVFSIKNRFKTAKRIKNKFLNSSVIINAATTGNNIDLNYNENHTNLIDDLDQLLLDLEELVTQTSKKLIRIKKDNDFLDLKIRQKIMSNEAMVAKLYFSFIKLILSENHWKFEKRTRRPALDLFNALLNYGYAVLQGLVINALTITGFDIYAGYLHTDRAGRESLSLDFMEQFRQFVVDETIIKLILNDEVHDLKYPDEINEILIDNDLKRIYLNSLFKKMDTIVRGKKLNQRMIILARNMGNYLRGFADDFIPFLIKVKDEW